MCLDDQVLSTYIDGELVEPWKTQVEEHLSHCSECSQRYEKLRNLQDMISSSQLREDEFAPHKNRVWKYLEKTCMTSQPVKMRYKGLIFSKPVISAVAAALVVLVGLNFFIIRGVRNSGGDGNIPVINTSSVPGESETNGLLSIRTTNHETAQISPEDLSVEQLLTLLDSKGFDVELKLKNSVSPVEPLTDPEADVKSKGDKTEESVDDNGSITSTISQPSSPSVSSNEKDNEETPSEDSEADSNGNAENTESKDTEKDIFDKADNENLGINIPKAQDK